jgi:hypothetical protein
VDDKVQRADPQPRAEPSSGAAARAGLRSMREDGQRLIERRHHVAEEVICG